jgi:hypothetical protein
LFDQEDMWGAVHTWRALKAAGHEDNNYLVIGPWRHSGANYDGTTLGELKFEGDTGLQWRRDVLKPFFDHYLKDTPKPETPRAMIYNVGANHWERFADWPLACDTGCAAPMTPLYLGSGKLSFSKPDGGSQSYVSDPAKPVPYLPRPVRFADTPRWQSWLTTDQRPFANRTDVLTYVTEPLTSEVRISGVPSVDLFAATTGTDADWVVKLIDVYPDDAATPASLRGRQLIIADEVFRGRFRPSFEHPRAITPNAVLDYSIDLHSASHVFGPGHRIAVQVQSTWFPLIDRNPQTFVPNIFSAHGADYKSQTHSVFHTARHPSGLVVDIADAGR